MADNKQNQSSADIHLHADVSVQLKRSMTRKNPSTGKSNYPTIRTGRTTVTNYINGIKSITNRNYRRIDD